VYLLFFGDQPQIVWIYDMIRINYSLLSGLCFLFAQAAMQPSIIIIMHLQSQGPSPRAIRRPDTDTLFFALSARNPGAGAHEAATAFLRRGAVTAKISASGSEIDFNSQDQSLEKI
jgi:hypothetical protein